MFTSKRLALACLALVPSHAADVCDAGRCDADDGSDEFAALQRNIKPHKADSQPEWRDALEAERAFFENADTATLEEKKRQWWFGHDLNGRPPYVGNVELPPQKPPFDGPYQQYGEFNYEEFTLRPLKQPRVVRSSNGKLDITLVADVHWAEVPGTGVRIKTRLYNGTYPGPTIRVKRGDQVNIKVINAMGPNCDKDGDLMWMRREGQATYDYPNGIPKDNARYQELGQNPGDPYNFKGVPNTIHGPNTTNFHTHGWHVSQREPQDDVIDVNIYPGTEYQYSYELSPYHNAGNSWYHPHWHGSVTLQVVDGMVGALIVDDSEGEAPDWISNARDEVLLVHEATWGGRFGPDWQKFAPEDSGFDPNIDALEGCFPFGGVFTLRCALGHRLGLVANLSADRSFRMEYAKGWGYEVGQVVPVLDFFSVNGQYRPTLEMKTGEWVRLRWIFASGNVPLNPRWSDLEGGSLAKHCETWLISKDSAWIEDIPRKITRGLFLGAGNRAQVMVRCSKPGLVTWQNSQSYRFNNINASQILLYVTVTGEEVDLTPPESSTPDRPRYLQSLLDIPDDDVYNSSVSPAVNFANDKPVELNGFFPMETGKSIGQFMDYDAANGLPGAHPILPSAFLNQPVRFTIQNMTFDHEHPMASFPVAEIIQVRVGGVATHSWHMHTHPVQLYNFSEKNYSEIWGGFFEKGDWHDVLQLPPPVYDVRVSGGEVTVRFQTDCYSGPLIIHCHVLYHEDLGMMTWFNTTGKDHTINPRFENEGIFKNPPTQCTKPGQQCALPRCTDYKYAPAPDNPGAGKGGAHAGKGGGHNPYMPWGR